jgi:CheY-like chemotaxis protein/class 3 adenylate cyclase
MSTEEISFHNQSDSYCVCVIDIVGSTKVISQISTYPDKIRKYYSVFLNSMSTIIKKHGGIIIKNIGDSLVFYFPKTSDCTNRPAFRNVTECCVTMMAAYRFVNSEMSKLKLPPVNYRISADYGKAIIAKSTSSHTYDLFGPILDLCTKINSNAPPNGMVIGNDLYQILKGFLDSSATASVADDYNFEMIGKYSTTIGLKQSYPIFSVMSKYTSCNTTTAQQVDPENLLKLRKEKQGKQIEQQSQQQEKDKSNDKNNILIVDDEPDIAFTYKSILNEEGYNVDAFTDPRQALRHFSQLDPLYYKLILLDIRMPNVNGFQIYYKFKALNPDIKILFVTALDVIGDELASMLPGFSSERDLIKKPLNSDQYINKIKSALHT